MYSGHLLLSPEVNHRETALVASYSPWLGPLMAVCIRALTVRTSRLALWSVMILFKQLLPLSTEAVFMGMIKHSSTAMSIFGNSLP